MLFDGLKDAVVRMLAGERVQVNTGTFSNDMTNFQGKDDVLTLLIHLGYLSYHWPDKTVTIPNKEVSQEYINAISTMKWSEVTASVEASKILLEALWNLDEKAVAEGIDKAHRRFQSFNIIIKMHFNKPAVIMELKWDKSAKGAISQIKEKQYVDALKEYQGIYFWWELITRKIQRHIPA